MGIVELMIAIGVSLLGILTAAALLYRDGALERYYSKALKNAKVECSGTTRGFVNIPSKIIVNTGHRWSAIRLIYKRFVARYILRKNVPEVLIIKPMSPDEQKAFLIKKGFSSIMAIRVFDRLFASSLINYETYKFVIEEKMGEGIEIIVGTEFEEGSYREEIANLDSSEHGEMVVINPKPQEKPPLRDLILPIAFAKQKEAEREQKTVSEIEKDKIKMMRIIEDIANGSCGVLLFGKKPAIKYIDMIIENIGGLNSILLGARGRKNIGDMEYGSHKTFTEIIPESWSDDYERWSIEGVWEFSRTNRVGCLWHYYFRK